MKIRVSENKLKKFSYRVWHDISLLQLLIIKKVGFKMKNVISYVKNEIVRLDDINQENIVPSLVNLGYLALVIGCIMLIGKVL